jgi:hypothetical protein
MARSLVLHPALLLLLPALLPLLLVVQKPPAGWQQQQQQVHSGVSLGARYAQSNRHCRACTAPGSTSCRGVGTAVHALLALAAAVLLLHLAC